MISSSSIIGFSTTSIKLCGREHTGSSQHPQGRADDSQKSGACLSLLVYP